MDTIERCGTVAYWWNGEYEGYCELPRFHEDYVTDHWDGLSWYNDENERTDDEHEDYPIPTAFHPISPLRLNLYVYDGVNACTTLVQACYSKGDD